MQKSATQQLQAARQEAHALYIRHLSLIRLDLDPQSEYWDVLQLKGIRKQTISGWLGQVTTFYDNIGRVQDILKQHHTRGDRPGTGHDRSHCRLQGATVERQE